MKKKLKIGFVLFVIILFAGLLVYNYVFNTEHRNITNEEASVSLSADELYLNFENEEATATVRYLDKVVQINGEISSVEDSDIVLNNRIQVSFNSPSSKQFRKGESITIKGRCVGYDELLEVVKIDQSIIINK